MKRFVWLALSILGAFGLAACEKAKPEVRGDYHITNVTVVDGTGAPVAVQDVTITGGKITAISKPGEFVPVDGIVIDATGKFLIPGLWDMHVHIAEDTLYPDAPAAFVENGVTTIRDAGGHLDVLDQWRVDIENGQMIGPHILRVGPTLNGEKDASFHREVLTPKEGEEAVRDLARQGVDGIKVHRAISPDVLMAIVKTTHSLGLKVSGHLPLGSPPTVACDAGMDSVEHVGSFLEAWVTSTERDEANMAGSLAYMLSDDATPLYECLKAKGIVVTPTILIYPYIAKSRGGEDMIELGRQTVVAMQRIAGRFREYGIPLMAGTDAPLMESGIPFGEGVIEELEILKGAGYSNLELLQIATKNPAEFMGLYGETGSIEVGKRADLVLLRADPLEDISNLKTVEGVFVNGRRVK